MDFGNNLNWDLVLRTTYIAELNPAYPRGLVPIPTKVILVDRYTLIIGTKSTKAKPTWHLGAYVSPRLLFSPSSTSEFVAAVKSQQRQFIELNKLTLVQFTDFGVGAYLLEVNIPPWIEELSIEVWKYQGVENAKPLPELIQDVKVDLGRIESKVDAIENYGV